MRLRNLLLLLALSALWGPSFLFIKVAVAEIPPFTVVLGRVAIGALLLLIVLRVQGRDLPGRGRLWRHLAILGLVQNAIPFALFSWGELVIDSALASILNGTTPIFTILLAHFYVADDRLNAAKIVGVVLGFGGLLFLIAPSLAGGLQATTLGLLAVTLASFCYGVAGVYGRLHMRGTPPLVAPAGQLLMASFYLLPLSLLERPFALPAPSAAAVGSLLALGLLGTGVAFVLYYRLLETAEPSYISMVTYIVPVFGVILGVLVLDEQLTWNVYAAFALILLGVAVVNGLFRPDRWRRRLFAHRPTSAD